MRISDTTSTTLHVDHGGALLHAPVSFKSERPVPARSTHEIVQSKETQQRRVGCGVNLLGSRTLQFADGGATVIGIYMVLDVWKCFFFRSMRRKSDRAGRPEVLKELVHAAIKGQMPDVASVA